MMKLFTKNKKKKDNKGFSLVELIVVIAIMAILAVALAPRLIHYLDKARKSNDNQVIDVAAQAVQSAIVDDKLYAKITTKAATNMQGKWFVVASGSNDTLTYNTSDANIKPLVDEIVNVVSGWDKTDPTKPNPVHLQSDDADKATASKQNLIIARFDDQYNFEVRLYYGTTSDNVGGTLASFSFPASGDENYAYMAQNSK